MKTVLLMSGLMAQLALGQGSDTWTKSKECAARSEKVTAEMKGVDDTVMSWNHFSPKYDRCYLEIHRMFKIVGKPVDRFVYISELQDAFEPGRNKASITETLIDDGSGPGKRECYVDGPTDCGKTIEFFVEHMKN